MANLSSEERRKRYSTIARKEDIEQSEARKDINLNTKADERRSRYASKDYLEKYNAYHAPTRYDGSAVNRYLNAYGLNQQRQADRMQEYRNRYEQQQFMNAQRDAIRNGVDNGNNPLGLKNLENPLDDMRRLEAYKEAYGKNHKLSYDESQKLEKAYGKYNRQQLEQLKEHFKNAPERDYSGEIAWVNEKLLKTATGKENIQRQNILESQIKDADNRLERLQEAYADRLVGGGTDNGDYLDKVNQIKQEKSQLQNELNDYKELTNYSDQDDFAKYKLLGEANPNNPVRFFRTHNDEQANAIFDPTIRNEVDTAHHESTYTGGGSNQSDRALYRAITDEEADNYSYILGKYGQEEADKYLQAVAKHTDVNGSLTALQEAQEQGYKNPLLRTAESIGLGLITPVEAAKNLISGDEFRTYDDYKLAGRQEALRSGAAEKLTGGNEIGTFLYNTATSAADNLLRYAVGGGIGAATGEAGAAEGTMRLMMGGQVMDSAMKNALDRGLSDSQAVTTALISAVNEELFETISLSNLKAMQSVTPKNYRQLAKNIGKQFLGEGSEEMFTDIGNAIADDLVNGEKSEIRQNVLNYMKQGMSEEEAKKQASVDFALQLVESGLSGGITGAAMGGAVAVDQAKSIKANQKYNELFNTYKESGLSEEDAVNTALSEVMNGLQTVRDKKGNVKDYKGLNKSIDKAIASAKTINENVKNIEAEMNGVAPVSEEDIRDNKKDIRDNEVNNEYLTDMQRVLSHGDITTDAQAQQFLSDQDEMVAKYPDKKDEIIKATVDVYMNGKNNAEVFDSIANKVTNTMTKNKTSLESKNTTSESISQKEDKPAKVEFKANVNGEEAVITSVNKDNMTVRDSVGNETTIPINAAEMSDGASAAVEQAKQYGKRGSRLYLENMAGNIRNYTYTFNDFYNAGKQGKEFYGRNTRGFDTDFLREVYDAGVQDGSKASKTGGLVRNDARYTIQESEARVLDAVGKAFNVTIQMDHMLSHDANGYLSDDVIHISTSAEKPSLVVFSHEFTHRLEDTSPEAYKAYKDYVIDYLKKTSDEEGNNVYETREIDLKNAYARQGVELSDKELQDELVANATESFLTDTDFIEDLVKENKSLAQQILDVLKQMLEDLKNVFAENYDAKSKEGKALQDDLEAREEALKLWTNAIKNQNKEAIKKNDTRYSMKELENRYDELVKQYEEYKDDKDHEEELGDIEADLSDIVEEYAKKKGFDTLVYHGTQQFGFTKMDVSKSDDNLSVFTTSTNNMASSYSGTNRIRQVNETGSLSDEEKLKLLKNSGIWKDVRYFKANDEKQRLDYLKEQHKRMSSWAKQNVKELYDRNLMSDFKKFSNNLAEGILFHNIDVEQALKELEPLQNAHFVISDYANDMWYALQLLRGINVKKSWFYLDGRFETPGRIGEYNVANDNAGNYQLYANTKDMLEVNGLYSNWNEVPYSFSSNKILEAAKIIYHITSEDHYGDLDVFIDNLINDYLINTEYIHVYNDYIPYNVENRDTAKKEANNEIDNAIKILSQNKTIKDGNKEISLKEYLQEKANFAHTSTRNIVKDAYKQGYKGVIFKNIYDNGGRNTNEQTIEAADVYAFFNPQEQLKSADPVTYDDEGNVIPLSERFNKSNDDIRFSLKEDSEGNKLSKEQQEFFKDSKAVDDEGNLLVMYHGSREKFTEFNLDAKGVINGRVLGDGFYFTNYKKRADYYGKRGKVFKVYLNIKNPLYFTETTKTPDKIKKILDESNEKKYEEYKKDESWWGNKKNISKDKFIKDNRNNYSYLKDAIYELQFLYDSDENVVSTDDVSRILKDLGYDGIIFDSKKKNEKEIVAFYPNQIKNVDNEKPTDNPDIRYSLKEDYGSGGYSGKSMSNRAVRAYEKGEKPLSKWTKNVLLDEIDEILYMSDSNLNVDDFKKLTVAELKDNYLDYSSWHHTGALYNNTDFYSLNEDKIIKTTKDDINKIIESRKTRKAEQEELKARKEESDRLYKEWRKKVEPIAINDSHELLKSDYLKMQGFELTPFTTKSGKQGYKYTENGIEKSVMADSKVSVKDEEYKKLIKNNDNVRFSLKEDSEGNKLSPQQQEYFKDSKAVDENGDLQVVYHGTVSDFTIFDREYGNAEGDFGKGFYFTNNIGDVENNYANEEGSDLKNKIQQYAERLQADEDMDEDEAMEAARERFIKSDAHYIESYLNIKNPVIISDEYETYILDDIADYIGIDIEDYEDEDDYYAEYDDAVNDFISEMISDIEYQFEDVYNIEEVGTVLAEAAHDGGIKVNDLKERINNLYLEGEEGLVSNEVTRYILEYLEYDGIIDKTVSEKFKNMHLSPDTVHYIVFNSNQAKRVDNTNPTENPDIRFSLKEESNITRNDVAALTGNNEYMAEAVNDLEETLNNRYGDLLFDVKNYELYDVFDEICKQYNIKGYSKQKFARNVKELFDYIKNVDHPDGVDTTMLAMQIAADMLDKGSVLDTTMLEMYPTLPEELRNKKIKISQQDRADLDGGYARFRRKYFGNLTLTDEGTEVDTVYEGLSAQYPELFASDITHPADRLTQIGNVVDLFKRTLDHIQGASKEESAFIIAQDIINKAVLERTKHEDSIAKNKRLDIQAKVREQVANLKKAEKEIYYENIRLRRRIKTLESLNNNANNKIAKQEKEWEDYKSGKKQVKGQEKFYRKQYYEKLKEEFVLGEVTRNKAKNRAERQATIDMIKNLTNKLSRTVLRPSENNYVPTYLLNSMIDVLQMIDLDSGYRNPDGSPTKVYLHLQNLKKQYEALRTDAKYNASGEDEQIKQVAEVIDRIAETVKDKRVNQLTNYELENLLALMKIIHYQINRSQELFKNQSYKRVADLSEKARENIKKAGREFDPDAKVKNIANKYLNNTLSPVRLFKRLEGYAKDGALTTIAEELQNGEKESKLIKQTANDILKDLYETKEARKLLEEFRTKKLVYKFGEKEVVITPEMRVALYLHSLNEDNYRHIVGREKEDTQGNISYEGGGMVIPNYHKQKKSTSDTLKIHQAEKYTGQDVIKLTPQNIETIIKDMNEYDRMIVKKYKDLNSYITDKLNDTTEELYGYKKATVKNYFPIIVDKSMLELDSDVLKLDKTIENMGSLKSRVNSVQPIYLEGVMDAIERQIDQAALFSGMAIPVRDFKKVWGLKTNETTLNREAQKAMGSYIDRYQKNLQGDLGRGREKGDSFALLGAGARGKMAMGALTGNLSVVMKQAASYPTAAGGILGYQDLFAGLLYQGQRGKDLEEIIKKYTPLYADRDTAGIVGVNINDMSAFKKKNPKLYYGLTGWIESVDKATVRRLWYASENYVKRNFKYEVGSDKFYKEVAKVWEDTVRRTQPIYDTMNRPEYLRQNSDLAKFLLMFKTQSFQNIGILVDAVGEYKARSKDYKNNQTESNKKDKDAAFKQLVKATSSQIIQMAVFTAITAIADAMLHRPKKWADEETGLITPESFIKTYFENYLGNMLGQLAFGDVIKDAVYIAAGKKYTRYDLTVAPLDAINDVITGLYNARQAVNTREYDKAWKNIIKASETGSQYGLGVPVKNIENLYKGVTGNVADIAAGKNPLEQSTDKQMYNRIYLAYQSGNPELAKELSEGYDEDKIKTKMVSKLKDEETIQEAADYRYKSELDKYQAIVDAYVSLGFDEDWVTSAISSVMNKEHGTTGSGEYNSNDLQRAIDISAVQGSKVAQQMYDEKYSTYKADGLKNDEAKKKALSSVRSAITGKYKSQYESGTTSQKVKIRDRLCGLRVAGERLYTYDSMKSWNK